MRGEKRRAGRGREGWNPETDRQNFEEEEEEGQREWRMKQAGEKKRVIEGGGSQRGRGEKLKSDRSLKKRRRKLRVGRIRIPP